MTLDRLSQITEVGIKSGITLRNINVEGAYVSGVVTATTLNAVNYTGNVTGNINPATLNVTGVSTFNANVFLGDGDIAYFGDGNDLLIFHNSTDSIIRDNGTGDLFIQGGNRIRLTNPTGIETYAVFNQDGSSELYYDNVKTLETTGAGVSVYGGVSATGLSTFSNINVGTGASISSPTNNVLTLGTNNAERLRITGIGSVGIGESFPDLPLHISGSNAYPASSGSVPTGFISLRRKSAGATHGLHMGVANASPFGSWIQAQDANALGTNYPLLLNPNGGNIGIGTINPNSGLHLYGNGTSGYIISQSTSANQWLTIGGNFGDPVLGYPSTGSLRFGTTTDNILNGFTERMRVDASGRITTPYQPTFQAYGVSGGTYVSGNYWIFPSTLVNIGNHYNTSNGIFTAPVAGTYKFWWSFIGNTTNDVYRYFLYKNNATTLFQLRIDTLSTGNEYGDNGSYTIAINLAASDTVRIYFAADLANASHPGSNQSGDIYVTFGGRLIG